MRIVKSYEKNDYFLVFLAAWVIFSMFLSRLRSDLCYDCTKY